MKIEIDVSMIISIISFFIMLLSIAVSYGKVMQKIKTLEIRADEDRSKDKENFQQLYDSRLSQGERIGKLEVKVGLGK